MTNAFDKQVGGNHYKQFKIQPLEFCQVNRIPYCESNVIKYVCRHGSKNGAQDIEKAIHNLEFLLQMEYPDYVRKAVDKDQANKEANTIILDEKEINRLLDVMLIESKTMRYPVYWLYDISNVGVNPGKSGYYIITDGLNRVMGKAWYRSGTGWSADWKYDSEENYFWHYSATLFEKMNPHR